MISWVIQSPGARPSARYGSRMAFCPLDLGIVTMGGTADGANAIHDGTSGATAALWQWTGTTWQIVTTTGDAPAGFGGALIYDGFRNVLVWVPAFDGSALDKTAELDLASLTWTTYTAVGIDSKWGCGAFDTNRITSVYFSGDAVGAQLTQEWDTGAHVWNTITVTHTPTGHYSTMAYDQTRAQMVLYGGGGNWTWTYDGIDWTQQTPTRDPPASGAGVQGASLVWNQIRETCVLQLGDTTEDWDGTTWTQVIGTGLGPLGGAGDNTANANAAAEYDHTADVEVYFYGGASSATNDTYLLADAVLTSITIAPSAAMLIGVGDTVQFTATGHYSNGTSADITDDAGTMWAVGGSGGHLSISSTGLVTGLAPGVNSGEGGGLIQASAFTTPAHDAEASGLSGFITVAEAPAIPVPRVETPKTRLGGLLDQLLDPITLDYVDAPDGSWTETADSRTIFVIMARTRLGKSYLAPGDGTRIDEELETGDPVTPEFVQAEYQRIAQILTRDGVMSNFQIAVRDENGDPIVDEDGTFSPQMSWIDLATGSPVDNVTTPIR